ncbi:MAG: hypothetical protein HQL74_15885 [Magnetococcales bacterium]|nr:hypothetical protein [Magnetococcales bacterium]
MAQEFWTRRKTTPRATGAVGPGNTTGRRGSIKTSILANQKVERRVRKNDFQVLKTNDSLPITRKQRPRYQISGKAVGLWALEGSVFLVAGLSMLARNSLENLISLFRHNQEPTDPYAAFPEEYGESFFDERLPPDEVLAECQDLRTNVEERKVSTLLEEETGLSSEVLDDQAGALRCLVSDFRG